ncbi:hypothetical protein [Pseudomonas sp. CGJS7]|uniref:hypothetical protein n=1 Tax=Pseudomonas sp. CGJS7 TaxID=3109348 RepID=UPI00300A9450
MPNPTPLSISADLLLQLLQFIPGQPGAAIPLVKLDRAAIDHIHGKAIDLHHRAIAEARDLLDVALESLEHSLQPEHQRRLIERADDELASSQRWGELAANARFCREHPELARELAGDSHEGEVPDAEAIDGAKPSAQRRARRERTARS